MILMEGYVESTRDKGMWPILEDFQDIARKMSWD